MTVVGSPEEPTLSPTAARHYVGAVIKRLREVANLTQAEVVAMLPPRTCDATALSRIERGERKSVGVVKAILRVLVNDAKQLASLESLVVTGHLDGWWMSKRLGGTGDRQRLTADLECGVEKLCIYQNALPPGQLQTEEYARYRAEEAVAEGERLNIKGTVNGKRLRQEALIRGDAKIDVVLEPQVLERWSAPRDVMRRQLMHLYEFATKNPRVNIRVLNVRGWFGGVRVPRSPFEIFAYKPIDLVLVDVDNYDAGRLLTSPEVTARYQALFDQMDQVALSVHESARLIREAAASVAG